MKTLHEGKKPGSAPSYGSSSSTVTQASVSGGSAAKKKKQTKRCGLEVSLQVLFQSEDEDDDEEEFLGFTLQEAIEVNHCTYSEALKYSHVHVLIYCV